jgi:hypothetical protein
MLIINHARAGELKCFTQLRALRALHNCGIMLRSCIRCNILLIHQGVHFALKQAYGCLIQGTFGVIQGTFGAIQGTFGAIQGTFGVIQGTFGVTPAAPAA